MATVETWKELFCGQCEGSPVFMRAKELADHKLEVHGPTKEQLIWAVQALHSALHGLLSNPYMGVTTRMYDEFAQSKLYTGGVAAANHKVVQRIVRGD
jgi:hypothetical protein